MVDEEQQDKGVAKKPLSMGGLIVRLSLVALAVIATMAAVIAIPDETDYGQASVLKHNRLHDTKGRKFVLVGGSNLSYGINSHLIERETGCPSINMGMNGYFGPRFMFAEVSPEVHKGDIVVVALEWDSYGKSVDGTGLDLFAVAKSNPASLGYMTWSQRQSALSFAPQVAQAKVMRLIRSATTKSDENQIVGPDLVSIESYKNFNAQGDLNGHVGIVWPGPIEEGLVLTKTGIDPQIVPLIKSFSKELKARGVSVIVSYTPTMRHYYEANASKIDDVHRQLTSGPDAVSAPRPPKDYAFDRSLFFDTVYHLNAQSRDIRTSQLIGDVRTVLNDKASCRAQASVPAPK